jgi:hypothetical protein
MGNIEELESNVSLSQFVAIRRDQYHEARFEYEMSLRHFLNDSVDRCPCCFKGFYKDAEKSLTIEMIKEGVEPNDLDVLEAMRSKVEQIREEQIDLIDKHEVSEASH